MTEIREVSHGTDEYGQTIALRLAVLRQPLGLNFSPEELAAESTDIHLAAFQEGQVIACLVLVPKNEAEIKMRQVAVRPDRQGSGIGSELVRASEALAKERGFALMSLHARDSAVHFYERLDYHVEGDTFEEVTIPHVKMVKDL